MTASPPRHRENGHEQPVCVSRRHTGTAAPVPVAPGLRICADCRDSVEDRLVDLPVLFELSADMLDPRPRWPRERVSGQRTLRGIVLRDAVVSVRADILGVLVSWCGLVAAERGVPGPTDLAIRRITKFLAVHVHWLCGHPAAPDLVDELTDLAAAVDAAVHQETGFRVRVGPCPKPGCAEFVDAEAHREGAEPYEVSCAAGHVWAPESWLSMWYGQNGQARDTGPRSEGVQ